MANEFKHKDPGTALTQAEFIASDGTGHIFDGQAAGDILYAFSTTVLKNLAKATDGNVLELASGLPAWTASPTIGSTSWSNATHAHGADNSGGTLNTSALGAGTLPVGRGGTGITSLDTGVATFLGTSSSANLRSALTDETGTGAAVFADTPSLVTPALGTPGSGVLTNCTGLPEAGLVNDAVTLAKMDGIARGSIIYGDASGDPAALAKGTETYVLTAGADDISWAAASAGAVTLEGSNVGQVESTSTCTTACDLISATSLSITATQPFLHLYVGRKTAGAAAAVRTGTKLNDVDIQVPTTGLGWWQTSGSDRIEEGGSRIFIGPRVATHYEGHIDAIACAYHTNGTQKTGGGALSEDHDGSLITALITSVTVKVILGDGAITVGIDELQVYSYAIS